MFEHAGTAENYQLGMAVPTWRCHPLAIKLAKSKEIWKYLLSFTANMARMNLGS